MKRKTNLFYLNGPDSKFITFSNYTEALTGNFLSTDTKLFPSRAGAVAEVAIEAVVGPEFVTGSTRMKSGTATKLILNMISTAVMIRLGHVRGNRMVDMQLTNAKLVDRGTRMIMSETDITDYDLARELLLKYGSVRAAVEHAPQDC